MLTDEECLNQVKHSSASLLHYLKGLKDNSAALVHFTESLLLIFKQYQKNDRLEDYLNVGLHQGSGDIHVVNKNKKQTLVDYPVTLRGSGVCNFFFF